MWDLTQVLFPSVVEDSDAKEAWNSDDIMVPRRAEQAGQQQQQKVGTKATLDRGYREHHKRGAVASRSTHGCHPEKPRLVL